MSSGDRSPEQVGVIELKRNACSANFKENTKRMRLLIVTFMVSCAAFADAPAIPTGHPSALDKLSNRVGIWDLRVTSRFLPEGPEFKGRNIEIVCEESGPRLNTLTFWMRGTSLADGETAAD